MNYRALRALGILLPRLSLPLYSLLSPFYSLAGSALLSTLSPLLSGAARLSYSRLAPLESEGTLTSGEIDHARIR